MPEKLARSVVVTPCCRHHSLTERPLLRHSWICAAHSCSSARCFNSALVILTSHNTTVAKPFATFRYYCLMCVYARLGLTVTFHVLLYWFNVSKSSSLLLPLIRTTHFTVKSCKKVLKSYDFKTFRWSECNYRISENADISTVCW